MEGLGGLAWESRRGYVMTGQPCASTLSMHGQAFSLAPETPSSFHRPPFSSPGQTCLRTSRERFISVELR